MIETRQPRSLAAEGLFLALFLGFGRGTPGTRRQDNSRRCGRRVGAIAVEHRYIRDIIRGAEADGLKVAIE
jgi:hypothetical protein